MIARLILLTLLIGLPAVAAPARVDPGWMQAGKYGVFVHYQYRILLGYCIRTEPKFPEPSQMNAAQWNSFVDAFDAAGFAEQMAAAKVGWVLFCIDDHHFAWPCSPNRKFSEYTGYAPGEKCSKRDLILDVANALKAKGIPLVAYFAGLNGYMKEPQVSRGLADDGNSRTAPSAETRRRRLDILEEYANRWGTKIAGWWFDGMEVDSYAQSPGDWRTIGSIVHAANPRAVIAFSYARNEQACLQSGVDDFTGGDTWAPVKLEDFTPRHKPAQSGILWHGKIYCGDVYHGLGTANLYEDKALIDWITACNAQGGVCTLDWPFDPRTGLIKDFGFAQMKRIAQALGR